MKKVKYISILDLEPSLKRDLGDLSSLVITIRQQGIIEPLIVRQHPTKKGKYQVVCGYRRFEAAKRVGLSTVPCIIQKVSDKDATYFWLIENIDRKDLNPIEEGNVYETLTTKYKQTQESIAKRLGKSQEYVSSRIQMRRLDPIVKDLLRKGEITPSHGKELLRISDSQKQVNMAKRVAKTNMRVGQLRKEIDCMGRPEDFVAMFIDEILGVSKHPLFDMSLAKCQVQSLFTGIWKVHKSMKYQGKCNRCEHKDLCGKIARETDKTISAHKLKHKK